MLPCTTKESSQYKMTFVVRSISIMSISGYENVPAQVVGVGHNIGVALRPRSLTFSVAESSFRSLAS